MAVESLDMKNTKEREQDNSLMAAYIEGIQKLAEASRLRGWLKY